MTELEQIRLQIVELTRKSEELLMQGKAAAIAEVKEKILLYKLTPQEIGVKSHVVKEKGGIHPPKYVLNGMGWTGFGRKPGWLLNYLQRGGQLEDLMVK